MTIKNRLTELFANRTEPALNIYFTAGYPELNDTAKVIQLIEENGGDLVEVGLPYSDPMADGPTIQESSAVALSQGITLETIFNQVAEARKSASLPIILMGYVNQMMQYGIDRFIARCEEVGVDGLIIPDMPAEVYEKEYKERFESANIAFTFLITPQTEDERIKKLDSLTTGFLYVVSSSSITGAKSGISDEQIAYFKRINSGLISSPKLIGFGISDKETFETASEYAEGAIIGSAFIKMLKNDGIEGIPPFLQSIK